VVMPDDFFVAIDKEGVVKPGPGTWPSVNFSDIRSLSAYSDGIAIYFESYKVTSPKEGAKYLIRPRTGASVARYNLGEVENIQVTYVKPNYHVINYFVYKSAIYVFGIAARDSSSPLLAKLLGSILLYGKPVFNLHGVKPLETQYVVSLVDLNETPVEIVEDLITKKEKSMSASVADKSTLATKDEGITPPEVLLMPISNYTEVAHRVQAGGTVRLRATLLPNGHIGRITIRATPKYGLTDSAIRAAKRTKFLPAEKDGTPRAAELTFDYTFGAY